LSTSSIGFEYENLDYETLDYETAEIIISHLKENDNPRDCREQWKKFTKQL
jgi:hypothetical protein